MSTSPNQIVFAKEVMINLKRIGISLVISIAVFIILYFTMDWSKADAGSIVLGQDMKYYHERQHEIFREDILGKSTWVFLSLCSLLIIGRYILMGYKWVSNTSKLES